MRLVPVRTREEPGEGGWIIAVTGTVINPVFAEKRLSKWYSGEGVGIIVGQGRAIRGAQNPIKSYVRVAERKLLPRLPRPVTKHYCVWIASGNREYLRNILNRAGFVGKNLLVKEARESLASEKDSHRGI
jgi:hypothetical protein